MSGAIDAVGTSAAIKSTYRRYLQSLLTVRDTNIDGALREAIESSSMLDKGPYLEATPPYAPGASLQDLMGEAVLASGFDGLASGVLPLDRPLYKHQEALPDATSSWPLVPAPERPSRSCCRFSTAWFASSRREPSGQAYALCCSTR